jgi:hypothetical protein
MTDLRIGRRRRRKTSAPKIGGGGLWELGYGGVWCVGAMSVLWRKPMTSINPTDKPLPVVNPQQTPPAPAPAQNDGDADDGAGKVRSSVDKGVGANLDKLA